MMTRAQLRLDLLRIIYHPGKATEHNIEILRAYEAQAFGDLAFEDDAPPAPPKLAKAK